MRITMKKLFAIMLMTVAVGASAEAPEKYNKYCIACHASGAAGAPKTGDVAAWEPRLAQGMDTLVATSKAGLNAMPSRGLCSDCTDEEFKALIEYMSSAQ
jgi:cytochrome c5